MQSWYRDIEAASTEAQVLAITRDYVSLWSPKELREFPEDCRSIKIESQADIPRWRQKLSENYPRTRDPDGSMRVDDLVSLVSRASERLGEIRGAG